MVQKRTAELRRMAIHGFESVAGSHNFYALLDFDITNLRKFLRQKRQAAEGGSLFSFIIKAIAKCLEEYPEFNSMINLKHTTHFDEVDINIPIELEKNGIYYTKQNIIRNANLKTVSEIAKEIDESKRNEDDGEGFVDSKLVKAFLSILPNFIISLIFKLALLDHKLVKKMSGTVFVTSVSMFSNIPGYVIPFIGGPKAVSFAIGSSAKKPVVYKNEITIKEMLNVTISFNHDLIDGAPAARFVNKLRRYIETNYEEIM